MASAPTQLPSPDFTISNPASAEEGSRRRRRKRGKKEKTQSSMEDGEAQQQPQQPQEQQEQQEQEQEDESVSAGIGMNTGSNDEEDKEESTVTPQSGELPKKKRHRAGRKHRAKLTAAATEAPDPDTIGQLGEEDEGETEAEQGTGQVEEMAEATTSGALSTTPAVDPTAGAGDAVDRATPTPEPAANATSDKLVLELRAWIFALQDRNTRLREDLEEVSQRHDADRRKTDDEIGSLMERAEKAEYGLKDSQDYIEQLEATLEGQERGNKALEQQVRDLKKDKKSVEDDLKETERAQRDFARDQKARLERSERARQKAESDLGKLQGRLRRLEQENEDLTEIAEAADAASQRLSKETKSLSEVNRQLSTRLEKRSEVDEEAKAQLKAIKLEIAAEADRMTRDFPDCSRDYPEDGDTLTKMVFILDTINKVVESCQGLDDQNKQLDSKVLSLEAAAATAAVTAAAAATATTATSSANSGSSAVNVKLEDDGQSSWTVIPREGNWTSMGASIEAGYRDSTPMTDTTLLADDTAPSRSLSVASSIPSPSPSPSQIPWRLVLVCLALLLLLLLVNVSLGVSRYREIQLWRAANAETLAHFWGTGGGTTVSYLDSWFAMSGSGCENNLLIAWWGQC